MTWSGWSFGICKDAAQHTLAPLARGTWLSVGSRASRKMSQPTTRLSLDQIVGIESDFISLGILWKHAWIRTFHWGKLPSYFNSPYAIKEPMIPAMAFPANQIECRETCSRGVYHIPVIKENPGLIALSNIPSRVRSAMRLP